MKREWNGYRASPKIERELVRAGTVSFVDGPYRATVISAGPDYFEAYTDNLPFVYGRPGRTLQEALDNLEAAVRSGEKPATTTDQGPPESRSLVAE